ncbi:unnamed protein product [Phytomonas sp. EM1]|nr:unnamed protein product [Phytomonas sp. EM1]|eukprot:CCW62347.1 unnamed protein product [Phytomonas sp. isolate EM1]
MLRHSFLFFKVSRAWPKGYPSVAASHFREGLRPSPGVVDPAQQRDANTSAKEQRSWTLTEEEASHLGGFSSHQSPPFPSSPAPPQALHRLTNRVRAYANLVRWDRPQGWQLLFLPCAWGVTLAVTRAMVWEGADPLVLFAPFFPIHLGIAFLAGAYFMRSAGCIVNDMWDRKIDAMMERTKGRPLASGEVSTREAVYLLIGHLIGGAAVAVNLSPAALTLALAVTPIWVIYPFMKRVTYMPQVVLGLCFNWGIFVGYAAVLGKVDWAVCLPAYVAAVAWTVLYDTIYGYQDREDDIKCGVKGLAVLIGNRKYILQALLIPIATGLLLSGFMVSQSLPYYFGVMICVYYLHVILDNVNIFDRWSCAQFFKRNVRFAVYVLLSMFLGNLMWAYASEHETDKDANTNSVEAESSLSRFLFLDQRKQPRLYNSDSFNWFDRVVHPVFVQAEVAKISGETDPPPVPAWMRREYVGDNMTMIMRFCGIPEETISTWLKWWYSTMDHYNVFSKLVI